MIREVGESIGRTVSETVGRAVGRAQERRPLPSDLLESDDAFLVVFDAPGATAEDVQVQFQRDAVRVRIDRFRPFTEDFEMRFPGRGLTLEGRARLPTGASVRPDAAEATVRENGTLEVRLPKGESDTSDRGEDGTDGDGTDRDAAADTDDEDSERGATDEQAEE